MFAQGSVRPGYDLVGRQFERIGTEDLLTRAEALSSAYIDQGVTFDIGGVERPFPLDIMPRLIEPEVWSPVEKGVAQRVRALERFLDDVYGEGAAFGDGVIPRQVVLSSPHFHRVVHGLKPPGGVRVHVAGIDLIRDNAGVFRVLEDNVRVPSGVSYVMTNRRAMATALPEVFQDHRIRPVSRYPRQLLAALRATAPAGVADPTVVVLTPGVYNSAYFEHALLARLMGIELVEGRDLVCQGGRVLMRTTQGLQPVHVIYRRVDDEFLDPVHFRSDSLLGVAGLLNAMRVGNVTVANAIGNGVADDKLVYTYVPDLIRYYLSEEPILPNVDTWRMEEPAHREEVMDRLHELVLKPVDGSGGKGIVIGPRATTAEIAVLRAQIESHPRGWIAQPVVQLSTHPTLIDGSMRPRHVDLRPFAVNDGQQVWVLPGGLTRVALPEGELIVNSSRGGGSKDTWVLSRSAMPGSTGPGVPEPPTTRMLLSDIAAGQQVQSQSQSQSGPSQSGQNEAPSSQF
ncbi:MAG: circularly permuted type 2 ATP-grasp protein, partial [Lapillicoccus sp.]